LLFFLTCCAALPGQDRALLTGTVSDRETGEPLEAVSVAVNRESGTISGSDGSFSIRLEPGEYTVEFHYVGYQRERKRVTLGPEGTVRLDVSLARSTEMLDEVVVSAGKFEQKLSDVTVSLEVLKPAQLSSQNITSLDMILEKTSGISILNGQPSIRGGSGFSYGVGSRVLMLVDDLPMISGDAGDIKWSFLPVENVNQVEIIKGASSVLYGSSALNGVINLRTRFPGNEPESEVTVFGGAYMEPRRKELVWKDRAPLNTGASFSHLRKLGSLDLSIGGNYFRNEGYRELEHEDRIRGSLALRYRFKNVEGLSAGISSSFMYTNHADFILWQDADSGAYRQNPETYARLFGHRYNIDPYVEYFNRKGGKHILRTRLYSVGNNTVDSTKNSFSKVWFAEYRYQKTFSQRVHWTNGASFMKNTVVAGLFNEHEGSNSAVYSQLDANVLPGLKLSTGIRWELNSLNGEYFPASPVLRAGLNYQAGNATFIRASFGQGYRFPSVAEKFVDAKTSGLTIFPNPGLDPEWGWSAEAGIKQGFRAGSWSGFADAAWFLTRYTNMIEYTFGYYPPENPTLPPFEYVGFKALNIETARIMGTEISLNMTGRLGPLGLNAMAGYTYMDPVDPVLLDSIGRDEEESYVLKYRRRHLFKSDLEVGFRTLFAGVNFQYNSTMIRVDEAFVDPLLGNQLLPGFPEYWDEHRHGYALVDVRFGWHISEVFRVNLVVRNLANVEYLGRPGDLGPPRSLTLQLRLTF